MIHPLRLARLASDLVVVAGLIVLFGGPLLARVAALAFSLPEDFA